MAVFQKAVVPSPLGSYFSVMMALLECSYTYVTNHVSVVLNNSMSLSHLYGWVKSTQTDVAIGLLELNQ